MRISQLSPLTGRWNSMEIDITEDEFKRIKARDCAIQQVCPYLSADEREFLKNGIPPHEWNTCLPPEEVEMDEPPSEE